MRRRTPALFGLISIWFAVFAAAPISAQTSTVPTSQATMSQHHQRIYEMMKDMTQEMGRMTEQMSGAKLTPDQRLQMARRMERMSVMMRGLAGLEARPALSEPEWQRKMDRMRGQMDEMMRNSRMR